MKALIATACIAVIAAVGYYFWGEWQSARERAYRAAELEGARNELFEFAKAKPHETEKVRVWCRAADKAIETTLRDNEIAIQAVRNCRYFDYL